MVKDFFKRPTFSCKIHNNNNNDNNDNNNDNIMYQDDTNRNTPSIINNI